MIAQIDKDEVIQKLSNLFIGVWMSCGNFRKNGYKECAEDFFYEEKMSFDKEIYEKAFSHHNTELDKLKTETKKANKK